MRLLVCLLSCLSFAAAAPPQTVPPPAASSQAAPAPSLRGFVHGGGIALPGAAVTVTQGPTTHTILTGDDGSFTFAGLAPGVWTLRVALAGFAQVERQVIVPADGLTLELTVAPLQPTAAPPESAPAPAPARAPAATADAAAAPPPSSDNALAVNGSVDNGATSQFGLSPAFGNHRPNQRSLYNGTFGFVYDSSALDARSYSLSGAPTAKPAYGDLTGLFQFGGPLRIPGIFHPNNAPFFFLAYQKSSSLNVSTASALMPTAAQRSAPGTSPQAAALLALYPLPNLAAAGPYNYQTTLPNHQHADRLQARLAKNFGFANQLAGAFSLASTRGDASNLFGFRDGTSSLGLNFNLSWNHSLTRTLFADLGVQFSRMANRSTPFFANRINVAGNAAVAGGDSNPLDWGPPSLNFSDGTAALSDALPAHNRNQTEGLSAAFTWNHTAHNVTFGGDLRRLEFNLFEQQNPRGSFTFNGAATGSAFGDFLAGQADAVALGFGNADKYFRQNNDDLYFTDDWRTTDSLSLNLGARWEYASPATELHGRLASLAVGPGFATATQALGSPSNALVRPDRGGLEPRLGLAWRPFPASSLLIRAGYGIYRDTAAYEQLALQLAQQAPFATSVSLQAAPGAPLTLASGLAARPPAAAPGAVPDLFAVAPDFRVGYAQTWKASAQRDLSGGYVMTLSYLGTKGTRGAQRFYPNTFAPGAANPCPACPAGFLYEASNGNSTYESGTATLQRRFHNGFAATVAYTYAHAIDDAALGGQQSSGAVVAQDWRNLDAERARSDFDQRHVLTLHGQYSTGRRWRASAFRGWTLLADLKASSGEPLTPSTLIPVPGTGFFGVRPDRAPDGTFSNPIPGQFGTAGRNSVQGPSQFTLNSSLQREFDLPRNLTAAFRLDATNLLNHAAFASLNPLFGSPQFLLPTGTLPMRSLQTTLRVTF